MKKSNIIIFVIIILALIAIFGFAIWDSDRPLNIQNQNAQQQENTTMLNEQNSVTNTILEENTIENTVQNETQTNTINSTTTQSYRKYDGSWFISEDAYYNAERIDDLMERREERRITEEEFQSQIANLSNDSFVELDIDDIYQGRIQIDFEITSPAPTQREARLDDIVVEIENNIGTFRYTDNWGTSGNGTITLKDNSVELKLETTSAAQGALWGVEGVYTFSYQRID